MEKNNARQGQYSREQIALEMLNFLPDTAEECAQLYGVLTRLTAFVQDVIAAKEHTFSREDYHQTGLSPLKRRRRQSAARLEKKLADNNWELPAAEEQTATTSEPVMLEPEPVVVEPEPTEVRTVLETNNIVVEQVVEVKHNTPLTAELIPVTQVTVEATPEPVVEIFTPMVSAEAMLPEPVAEVTAEEQAEFEAELEALLIEAETEAAIEAEESLVIVNDSQEPLTAPMPTHSEPQPTNPIVGEIALPMPKNVFGGFNKDVFQAQ